MAGRCVVKPTFCTTRTLQWSLKWKWDFRSILFNFTSGPSYCATITCRHLVCSWSAMIRYQPHIWTISGWWVWAEWQNRLHHHSPAPTPAWRIEGYLSGQPRQSPQLETSGRVWSTGLKTNSYFPSVQQMFRQAGGGCVRQRGSLFGIRSGLSGIIWPALTNSGRPPWPRLTPHHSWG